MSQPINKKILAKHPNVSLEPPFYTVLFDMHSIMKTCMVDDKVNTNGVAYGMIFQTMLQLKLVMKKKDFQYAYCMYDGSNAGQLRFSLLGDYKSNRSGKNFSTDGVKSDYYKEMDKFMKRVLEYSKKEKKPEKISEDQLFFESKKKIQEYLEELFFRQVEADDCEADDLIAWYVLNKKPNERIVIVSNDHDLSQLVSDENFVIQYTLRDKQFIQESTFKTIYGYHPKNVVLQKIICGDTSDVIYGVKSVAEKTLYEIMPEVKDRKVELYEVLSRVKELKAKREVDKKKPKKVYDNILNQVTDGCHPEGKLFEINRQIIDLKQPMLTNDAIEQLNDITYSPLSPEDRNLKNLYQYILRDGIDELRDTNKFSTFFSTFASLRDKEIKFYEKWMGENK
jgi:5'-3' exonuclease